ncbi:MAG: N-6 DNA methylase [Candidatus Omnitrophica bacterium]|nr:N-6 DNA methylase [Candidatus Omnitrophota bacterium]
MNKDQARKLIQNTFQGEFNKDQLIIFFKNSFHTTDFSKTFSYHGQYIKDSFKEFIKSYERVGQYTDTDGKVLDMLVVNLQKETSLVRARTAQRYFVARYSKERGEKNAALVAFVAPDPADWRFSFVKMEYTFEQTDKGSFKVKEDFTPAKRYSFLVGEHENSHTAQRQLVSLLSQDVNQPSFKDIEEVFNIEKVSQEFFERYRELYLQIKESLDVNVENDPKIKADFERCGVDTVDFAKKLLGQIVFLYFLQKKGWFGADKGKAWGTGYKDFLRRLFNREIVEYDNFFNDVLEPLFYEALATDRGQDAYWDKFQCRIPFLNGGLFEPINGYSWQTTDILLNNELFSNKTKTKQGDIGTGVLDVFDRFNFTVKEDEPLEKEVAVDPEMLGKVFENLLGVKDRKSKGAFYTPRQIVHYMCQESLINYLVTECGEKVDRKELEEFIRHGEMNIEHEARIIKEGKETRDYRHAIGETIRANAKEIDQKLADVRVCDPAVGSGAFLVGMMNEIFRARNILTNYLLTKRDRTLYEFKRQAIGHSLYGVDIDPGAVEIAKLRLWLSLVVDEEDAEDIKPLPNLDYKIMQGNSLLEEFEGIKLFDESLIEDALDNHKQIERLEKEREDLGKEMLALSEKHQLTRDGRKLFEKRFKDIDKKIKKLKQPSGQAEDELSFFAAHNEAKEKRAELQSLYDQFPAAVSKTRKEHLKKRIEELEWDLIETTLKEQAKDDALERVRQHKKANIKPFFLWKLHFGEVFKDKGGFDVVIGNPPYGFHQIHTKELKDSYKKSFKTIKGSFDHYLLFYEKAIKLITGEGVLSFIAPVTWLTIPSAKALRKFILDEYYISEICWFDGKVFIGADVNNLISFIQRNTCDIINVKVFDALENFPSAPLKLVGYSRTKFINNDYFIGVFENNSDTNIIQKILDQSSPLEEFAKPCSGYNPYEVGKGVKPEGGTHTKKTVEEKPYHSNVKLSQEWKPEIIGRDLKKYRIDFKGSRWIKYGSWLAASRDPNNFVGKRILVQEITGGKKKEIIAAYCDDELYYSRDVIPIKLRETSLHPYYILAFINSSLITWLHHKRNPKSQKKLFPKVLVSDLKKIPIKVIPEKDQKVFVQMVTNIIKVREKNIDADISVYDNKINEMIFNLYGLTEEEKKIVRNGQN